MNDKNRKRLFMVLLAIILGLLSSCGTGKESSKETENKKEPLFKHEEFVYDEKIR